MWVPKSRPIKSLPPQELKILNMLILVMVILGQSDEVMTKMKVMSPAKGKDHRGGKSPLKHICGPKVH